MEHRRPDVGLVGPGADLAVRRDEAAAVRVLDRGAVGRLGARRRRRRLTPGPDEGRPGDVDVGAVVAVVPGEAASSPSRSRRPGSSTPRSRARGVEVVVRLREHRVGRRPLRVGGLAGAGSAARSRRPGSSRPSRRCTPLCGLFAVSAAVSRSSCRTAGSSAGGDTGLRGRVVHVDRRALRLDVERRGVAAAPPAAGPAGWPAPRRPGLWRSGTGR